jgi:hypothetical protein
VSLSFEDFRRDRVPGGGSWRCDAHNGVVS